MSDVKKTTAPMNNDADVKLTDEMLDLILDQELEISAAGVQVVSVEIRDGGAPPRFHIKFPPDIPSAMTRAQLEEKRYDVGQNLGGKNLSFYVTKRVEQTKGWSV